MSRLGVAVTGTYELTTPGVRSFTTPALSLAVPAGKWLIGGATISATGSGIGALAVTDSKGNTYHVREQVTCATTVVVAAFDAVITTPLTTSDTITLSYTGASTQTRWAVQVDSWDNIAAFDTSASLAVLGGTSLLLGPTTAAGGAAMLFWGAPNGPVLTRPAGWNSDGAVATANGSFDRTLYTAYSNTVSAGAHSPTATLDTSDFWAGAATYYTFNPPVVPDAIPERLGTGAAGQQTINGTTYSLPLTSAVAVGERLIGTLVTSASTAADTLTISDPSGNTWTVRKSGWVSNVINVYVYDAPITTALDAGDAVVFTLNFARSRWAATVDRWKNATAYDVSATNSGTGTALSTGAVTAAGGIAMAAFGCSAVHTITAGSGWTSSPVIRTTAGSGDKAAVFQWKPVAAGSVNGAASLEASGSFTGVIVTYTGTAATTPVYSDFAVLGGEWVPCQELKATGGVWV